MFTITDENMKSFNRRDKYSDFDAIEDIQVLAHQENWCMVRTFKLMPTLFFMQEAGRRIWSLEPDDEYDKYGIKHSFNIITYYKKCQKQMKQ